MMTDNGQIWSEKFTWDFGSGKSKKKIYLKCFTCDHLIYGIEDETDVHNEENIGCYSQALVKKVILVS